MLTTYPHSHLAGTSQHLYLIISANLLNLIYLKVLKEKIKLDLAGIGIFNKNEFREELEKYSWDNVTSPI